MHSLSTRAVVAVLTAGLVFGAYAATAAGAEPIRSPARSAVVGARTADPVQLRVPDIGVDAAIIRLGLKADSSLQVPGNAFQSGWFTGSPRPGARGPSIVVGHVHWNGQQGVFANLGKLDYDDRVVIVRSDGSRAVFRVTRVSRFKKARFPSELVYGNVDGPELRLITCDGFDAAGNVYLDNLVVFAMLVGS